MYDLRKLQEKPLVGIRMLPSTENLFEQIAIINGTVGSPYEGYRWRVRLNFPQDYPFGPPTIHFIDKIFHPNVDYIEGVVTLPGEWNPATQIRAILFWIGLIFSRHNFNINYVLNHEARNLLSSNRDHYEYDRRVIEESARMKESQPELEVPP